MAATTAQERARARTTRKTRHLTLPDAWTCKCLQGLRFKACAIHGRDAEAV